MKQNCIHYGIEVREAIVDVDIFGVPVYDIVEEQEFCIKIDSEPKCENCAYYEAREIIKRESNEIPF